MLPTNDADLAAEFRERAKELRDRAAKFDRMADELDGGTPARKAETRTTLANWRARGIARWSIGGRARGATRFRG